MANYKVKIKINDYFPKIDAIPYDDFICLISCNNYYSRIKLTEYENQQFKFDLKIIRNIDLLFNIKVINYIDNNKLVGMYNLIIPHNKVNQILQRDVSLYKQQIKLIMNSNVKIKLFGVMMNITNIYLDLIFQISSINENMFYNNNQINKMKLYEMLGNNSYAKNYSKNKKKTKSNNTSTNDGKRNININLSRSPVINYNNYIYDFKDNDIDKEKKNSNSNNKIFHNIDNQKYSDINFNVMNYNYLNYLKIDNNNSNNNNYGSNVKFNINSRSPIIISKNINDLNNKGNINNHKNYQQIKNNSYFSLFDQNKLNDSSSKKSREKSSNYTNYQNISTKKKTKDINSQLYITPILRNDINEINNYNKKNKSKYLTEAQNSTNFDNINNIHENTEVSQFSKNPKYNNLIKNNSNQNIECIYNANSTNKNILYDKKNHLNKFIYNSKTIKKNRNSDKTNKIDEKEEIIETVKTQVTRNKIGISEFNESHTHDSRTKTPKDINVANTNRNNISTPFQLNTPSIKKHIVGNIILNTTEKNNTNQLRINIDSNNLISNFITDNKNETNDIKNIDIIKEAKEFKEVKENKKVEEFKENKNNENKGSDKKEKIILTKNEKDSIIHANENNNVNQLRELSFTQEEFKNKISKSFEDFQHLQKEIISQLYKNREFTKKLLLIKEKFYSELQKRNNLDEKKNHINIKSNIHVNVRGKINSDLYFNMKNIKSKEYNILYKIFYEHKNSPQYKALEAKRKLKQKMEQQKQVHSLLKLIRELTKKYENLSQIYNDDEKKKILFKSLLLRYGIREKEESKDNNLMDKFSEIKKKLEEEKNKNKMKEKQKEIQEDLYKNIIKEEDDEERSSISDHQMFKRKSSLRNRISWCSDDSNLREKENFESNKSNNDDANNSLLSSGLKKIKESHDENLILNHEKKNIKEDICTLKINNEDKNIENENQKSDK